MKYYWLVLLLGIIASSGLAQNEYIAYHNLVNQANRDWYEKEYASSLENFQAAFSKVDYVHSVNYAKAARSAAQLQDYKLTKTYLLEAAKRGYPNKHIDRKPFKQFRKSKEYLALSAKLAEAHAEHELAINKSYQRKIDSLHYIDQRLIRGNERVTGFELDSTLVYSDSANFVCLLQLIEQQGFPSEQNIGYQGYRKSWVLIHHNARLPQNHYYNSTLLEYLTRGEYMPENYCWVIDQGQEVNNEALVYYHWDVVKDIDQLTLADKQRIDQHRKAVGMPSIERIEVVEKSKVKRNRVKW